MMRLVIIAVVAVMLVGCRGAFAVGPTWYGQDTVRRATVQFEGGGYGRRGVGGFVSLSKTSQTTDVDNAYVRIWLLAEARYRHVIVATSQRTRLYGAIGVSAGTDSRGGALAAHLELGLEIIDKTTSFDISLRYRPAGLYHERPVQLFDPTQDVHMVQLAFALGRVR